MRKTTHPVFGLIDRLRSAVRTGRRLHLDPEQAQVLMSDEIYLALSRLEAKEMRKLADDKDIANKSANFGFGSARNASPGTSAGSSAISAAEASRGASQLLQKEVALTLRRKKRSMHSLPTS